MNAISPANAASLSLPCHIQSDYPADNGEHANDLQHCDWLPEIQNANARNQSDANSTPNRVSHAHVDPLQRERQEEEAYTVENDHQPSRDSPPEASRQLHASCARNLKQDGQGQMDPVHFVTPVGGG
jgi:hypothetical protein